jgi:hypothetical protein
VRASVVLAAVLAGACSAAGPSETIHLMQIEEVDVRIAESEPPQAFAHVRGIIPDGCSVLDAIAQERSGNRVTVTITVRRTTDGPCVQVIETFERDLRLEGAYPAGRYTVRVNDVARDFEV